jgi:hypothetical protein
LISGASGVLGKALIPFLTTGGHRVATLVRRKPDPEKDEIFWDPAKKRLDAGEIESLFPEGLDVIIHLAGENIGEGKWTREKKEKIVHSRTLGTGLLAEAAAALNRPPKVFLSASAIGFYGDRSCCLLMEDDEAGCDFISDVCVEWEESAKPALREGIRTAYLRIGVVLTPAGGALERLLPPFLLGAGGKIASGKQYMSWIGIDDVIGSVYHVMMNENIDGPINIVSPNPVTNETFSKTLARVLGRPCLFTVPESLVLKLFGEMGKEVLLSSTRVQPVKLIDTGYGFLHPELSGALSHLLGKL